MFIAILGRQPALGMAELERLYGSDSVSWNSASSAIIETQSFDFNRLGGSLKAGSVVSVVKSGKWPDVNKKIIQLYLDKWRNVDHKITLGISVYDLPITPRDIQKTAISLKQQLKKHQVSIRVIPNQDLALSTAASHHNKLGLSPNKVEIIVVRSSSGKFIIAESVGAQNITAFAGRDQARPKTDAFVGMLPPKLARMMVNITVGSSQKQLRILDPFCGTGVVLQEAALLGFESYGTDLSEKMVDYSKQNLLWLAKKYSHTPASQIAQGDAMDYVWQPPIDAVVAESYLGQPFSAPPSPAKLVEVRGNCNHIISTFLRNLASQIAPGTPVCLAVPAWRSNDGRFTRLPLISQLEKLGYTQIELKNVRPEQLIYYRPEQIVARELLLLARA